MKRHLAWFCFATLVVASGVACGPVGSNSDDDDDDDTNVDLSDQDHDGYTVDDGDCDDTDETINPLVEDDTCDGVDNDCNNVVDDPFNLDGDAATTCSGDCDDSNPTRYPGATEQPNGLDDDCDDIADNNTENYDDDGDGYSEVAGDCNDYERLIGPDSIEVATAIDEAGVEGPEGFDNDCDDLVDEAFVPCDGELNRSNDIDYPKAMELCNAVQGAAFVQSPDPGARNIVPTYGSYVPHGGASMAVLSTGRAVDPTDPSWIPVVSGTQWANTAPHPLPQPDPQDGCGTADPASVNDYTELQYTIKVPPNANSLSYDFNFMSGEFPAFVCTSFDDTFLAILQSTDYSGNISFDDAMRPVTINIGFFDVCQPGQGPDCVNNAELVGTGFEAYGGTGWLHTIAPVTGGEIITLRFTLHDEGDHVYDSLVLLDNFSWGIEPVDGPVTIPSELAPAYHHELRVDAKNQL